MAVVQTVAGQVGQRRADGSGLPLLQQRPELAAVIDNVLEASADDMATNSETAADNGSADRDATSEDRSGDKETPGDV